MIQAGHVVIFQKDLKSNLHVGKERESLDCNSKWQLDFTRFRLRVYKTLRQLRGKDPGLLSLTDVVFENVPARERSQTFYRTQQFCTATYEMDEGCPVEFANVKFTALVRTVLGTAYATSQFIKFVLEKKQFCVDPISGRRLTVKQVA